MHIREITLDGFKSYAQRTVVGPFDRDFNAITGLNGSGKSNILDAICFVLGLKNLSQVRATNLQELVYKQGQAGVSKASVTIVFDNSDRTQQPVGFEDCDEIAVTRQVIIGGKNKYFINGHVKQAAQVQNLFHSVQLNVNNPHFLIMQGRITKVLNMKPTEILGMVEEAAGTRMYENKKIGASRFLEKNDSRVSQLKGVIKDEISPTLERLRQEKAQFMQWTANNTELERLNRFSVALEYQQAVDQLQNSDDLVAQARRDQQQQVEREEEIESEVQAAEKEKEDLQAQRDDQMGSDFQALKSKTESVNKELVRLNTKLTHAEKAVEGQKKSLSSLHKQKKDAADTKSRLERKLSQVQSKVESLEQKYNEREQERSDCQRQIQNLHAGMVKSGDQDESLSERLAHKKAQMQEARTASKQAKMKAQHLESSLHRKKQELQHTSSSSELEAERSQKMRELEEIQSHMHHLTKRFDPDEERRVRDDIKETQRHLSQCERHVDDLSSSLSSRLNFRFEDPYRNFDRSTVHGPVAKLMEVQQDWSALALEIAAGGKLYQIVVDDEKVAKDILQRGHLQSRVTFIPLNRISSRPIDKRKVDTAHRVASASGGQVWEPLDLIQFDRKVLPAMQYTLGGTLVCDSSDVAQQVTFHRDIKCRTVTLEGDSFDPAGTLQGGSAPNTGKPVLLRLHQLLEATREMRDVQRKYGEQKDYLESVQHDADEYRRLQQSYQLKEHELRLLEERIGDSSYAQLQRSVEEAEEQLAREKENSVANEETARALRAEVERLESDAASMNESRESRIQALESELKRCKKLAQEAKSEMNEAQQELAELHLEKETMDQDATSTFENEQTMQEQLVQAEKELEATRSSRDDVQDKYEEAHEALEKRREELSQQDEQVKRLQAKREALVQEKTALELERKKAEHRISRLEKDEKVAQKVVKKLEASNPWIEEDKHLFGERGTPYDFERNQPQDVQKRLLELRGTQAELEKKLNKKVMTMIEKAEEEHQQLEARRDEVERDRNQISSVINELDVKKNEALENTWERVNQDFNNIFSTLLPGSNAKLEPPEGGSILDGLQVCVAFGGVWKESLTELSGGQRSLLALSLILALLLFKPAPMYILDEVDAALDLSHTQNIGTMIRKYFQKSQFVIVSLKEGMFNNANALFRTKFVDGMSTVSRSVPGKE